MKLPYLVRSKVSENISKLVVAVHPLLFIHTITVIIIYGTIVLSFRKPLTRMKYIILHYIKPQLLKNMSVTGVQSKRFIIHSNYSMYMGDIWEVGRR